MISRLLYLSTYTPRSTVRNVEKKLIYLQETEGCQVHGVGQERTASLGDLALLVSAHGRLQVGKPQFKYFNHEKSFIT